MNPHKSLCFEIVKHGYFSALTEPHKTAKFELYTVLYKRSISRRYVHCPNWMSTAKSHPGGAEVFYRRYAVLRDIIFEKCDKDLPVEKSLAE